MPTALKVFFASTLCGLANGYLVFRIAVWVALKFLEGEHAVLLANAIGLVAGITLGISSAITAGVMAGRVTTKI